MFLGAILITAWYGNCSASDRKALQRVVQTAQYITGAKLPAIQAGKKQEEQMAVGVYLLAYGFSEGCPICVPFPCVFSSCKRHGSGPAPRKQDIVLVGLVKGKSLFQSAVSNRCSHVQKLFLVIRDSSSNIMYTIHFFFKLCKKN